MWKPHNKKFNSAAYVVDSISKAKIRLLLVAQLMLSIPLILVILWSGLSEKARNFRRLLLLPRCSLDFFAGKIKVSARG